MILKYVIFQWGVVLFPEAVNHKSVASGIIADNGNGEIKSAGFCVIQGGECTQCYGQSVSLGLTSRKGDQEIVNDLLTNNHMKYFHKNADQFYEECDKV